MPILRHECYSCGVEIVDLYALTDPTPQHCGEPMRLLMPRRVVGRVQPDSNGAHAGSGFAAPQPDRVTEIPKPRMVAPLVDPTDETAPAPAPSTGVFAKDYEQCTAAERDERWHDGAQALSAWTAKQLESKGEKPDAARAVASDAAQRTIEKARADSTRADGLT